MKAISTILAVATFVVPNRVYIYLLLIGLEESKLCGSPALAVSIVF